MITDVRKKGILLIASFLLLLAAGVYMAFAWYTKMTSASDMTFDAARWEYSANYAVDDFSIGVYTSPIIDTDGDEFVAIVNGKAAPGTKGFCPVVLSAEDSDAAVGYVLKVDKSTMSPEFQERIFFYQDPAMTVPVGTDWGSTTEPGNVMTGTIPAGQSKTVNIYWKWVYDLDELTSLDSSIEPLEASAEEFDAFDTMVGKNPERYEPDMRAQLLITGSQISPEEATGSQWIEMNTVPQTETTTPAATN